MSGLSRPGPVETARKTNEVVTNSSVFILNILLFSVTNIYTSTVDPPNKLNSIGAVYHLFHHAISKFWFNLSLSLLLFLLFLSK